MDQASADALAYAESLADLAFPNRERLALDVRVSFDIYHDSDVIPVVIERLNGVDIQCGGSAEPGGR